MTIIRAIQFQNKRVGSTFLQKAIDSHTDIAGIDEVFVNICRKAKYRKSGFRPYIRPENKYKTPESYLNNYIYTSYPDKHTIFKLMYNQIYFHDGLFDYIAKNKVSMIHLMRKNLVKQIISGLTAAKTNHDPVAISPDRLFLLVKDAQRENNRFTTKLKDHIKLVLYYEDIIGQTIEDKTYLSPNANIAICNFFGVEQQQLFATTKKKNKRDLSVYLPNIKEIKEKFKGTEFEWMV